MKKGRLERLFFWQYERVGGLAFALVVLEMIFLVFALAFILTKIALMII